MIELYYEEPGITIYHGDCRELFPSLPKVDLVLTDPPYGEVNRASNGLRRLDKGSADVMTVRPNDLVANISNCAGTVYIWCGTEQVSEYRSGLVGAGFSTRTCVWEKSNPSPMNGEHLWLSSLELCVFGKKQGAYFGEFCKSPVFRYAVQREQVHPTQKPVPLFARLISASSRPGETVLDPFMGSGTTLRAAKDLGRKAIGIEIEEQYCKIAVERLRQEVLPLEMV